MQDNFFDVCILGGGPAGYVASIRASQLGLKVAVIESTHLGGICLNWGCIPTKALLRSAEVFDLCKKANDYGVVNGHVTADIAKMTKRSREISKKLANGVKGLMKKNKVSVFNSFGSIAGKGLVEFVNSNGKKDQIKAKYIIIATGARPRQLNGFKVDNINVLDYKGAMSQNKIPSSLIVVGSGAIGMEFACFYNSIGVDVLVLEAMDGILPMEDKEISKYCKSVFEKKGIKFATGIKLDSLLNQKNSVTVNYFVDGKLTKTSASKILMAVGIVPNTENIGLHTVGVNLEKSRVKVNAFCQTNIENIFAIGDVNSQAPSLAHKASHEGVCVVEKIASLENKFTPSNVHQVNYNNVPSCTYTSIQIASVGMTEQAAIEADCDVKIGRFNLSANGKAIALGEGDGFVKVIVNKKTGELLGAHLCGAEVTEILQGFIIAKENELTDDEIANTMFPHPTISEAMHEAILSALGKVLHN
ncbi:MAG: dihydrolipoyl dehydrogenase [Alphaproteobacteria bacterium]|nr:dihydrolipoyl dehydrogenase [Rickettsiales bacterium]